jgi:hypothetical protein
LDATKSVVNGNGTAAQINQLFSSNFLMPSMAADAVTANRDGRVLGHNYYLFKQVSFKHFFVLKNSFSTFKFFPD